MLNGCSSGRELAGAGYGGDVDIAAELDDSDAVAILVDGAFRSTAGPASPRP
jgi:2-phosphosulfolactate phosphatase